MADIDLNLGKNKLNTLDPSPYGRPAVLLLHGLGSTGASWQFQMVALIQAGYRPIAPDLPGFGQSRIPGRRWSVAMAARACAGLLQSLDTWPVPVVGISMGGTLALQIALDHPELVKRLLLANTFARLHLDQGKSWAYYLRRFAAVYLMGMNVQARLVAERIFPEPGQEIYRQMLIEEIAQADPRSYRQAMRALGFLNLEKRLEEIHTPTLVVTGEQDTTIAPTIQHQLVAGIPGARQVIVPRAGHAVIIDQPEVFNRILLDFLKEET